MRKAGEIAIVAFCIVTTMWMLATVTIIPMAENYRHHGTIFLVPEQLDSCGRKIADLPRMVRR